MPDETTMTVIGWRERVDLPDWGLHRVRAKIDTGARTSVIDVARFELIDDTSVRFEVVYRVKPERRTKWIEGKMIRTSRVRPSSGHVQERIVCTTRIRIGDHEQEIELGLVCRRSMLCRMLIGRTALDGHFLVDPSKKYLFSGDRPGRASKGES